MYIYLMLIIFGLVLQLFGVSGYIYNTRLVETKETISNSRTVYDNDSGLIIERHFDGSYDLSKWKLSKRKNENENENYIGEK